MNIATMEFRGHASRWWASLCSMINNQGTDPIVTWAGLKRVINNRYVPASHHRNLFLKLNELKQGSLSIRDYYLTLEDLVRQTWVH